MKFNKILKSSLLSSVVIAPAVATVACAPSDLKKIN
jgi:hypothetical protein